MGRQRYTLEQVNDAPEWGQRMQGNLQRVLERVSDDRDGAAESTAAAATGTAFIATRAADWAGTTPTTTQQALDRLAYHVASGGGANPILELP